MTTYTFTSGTSISFNPAIDVLYFNSDSVSAADLQFEAVGTGLQVGINNQFMTLLNVSLETLASTSLSFANGSVYRNGSTGNDTLSGGTGDSRYNDYFDISKSGNDSVAAGNGNDLIIASSALNASDTIDGGPGSDILSIQGNYASAVVFTPTTVTGVETYQIGTGGPVHLTVGNDIFTGLSSAPLFDASGQGESDGLVLDASAVTVSVGIRASGGLAADTLTGGAGSDTFTGGLGNDSLYGSGGNDSLDGGDGNDSLAGGAGNDTLLGQAGNDVLSDSSGVNVLDGGSGSDSLSVIDSRSATLLGGTGDDNLYVHFQGYYASISSDGDGRVSETFLLDGGADNDRLLVSGTTNFGDGGLSFLTLNGGSGDDRLEISEYFAGKPGTIAYATLNGGDGGDTLVAAGVLQVRMAGGAGSDTFALTARQLLTLQRGTVDIQTPTGAVQVAAQPVVIEDFSAGLGGDVLDLSDLLRHAATSSGTNPFASGVLSLEQSGADLVLKFDVDGQASTASAAVAVAVLKDVSLGSMTSANVSPAYPLNGAVLAGQILMGTSDPDSLVGGLWNDTQHGFASDDTLSGLDGNDSIEGGDGADSLAGGLGNDTLLGQLGNDTLVDTGGTNLLDGGDGNDTLSGLSITGTYTLQGGAGNDQLMFTGLRGSVDGGTGSDTLTANGLLEQQFVLTGQVTLNGNDGDDLLSASTYSEVLMMGGEGADRLVTKNVRSATLLGGGGNDELNVIFQGYYASISSDGDGRVSESFVLDGGADDDRLTVRGGTNFFDGGLSFVTLRGGDGQDVLEIQEYSADNRGTTPYVELFGDQGKDTLIAGGALQVSLTGGEGADRFVLTAKQFQTLQLGTVTIYSPTGSTQVTAQPVVINDLAAGAGGDVIDVVSLLATTSLAPTANPFASGVLRLEAAGADTLLKFDPDGTAGTGSNAVTAAVIKGVSLASITADNFYPPHAPDGSSDTLAPTVTNFSPADEATGVAVSSNIVVTFSEAIQRGSGQIVLKTGAGATVATYDAATSANLSISDSTLTLNPSADLSAGTTYKVEFAPGTLKDLAGNSYAGITDYNFSTAGLMTVHVGNPLTGAISGSAGDDEYRGGLAGTSPFGMDSLQVVDQLGNATVTAQMVDPSGPYYSAAVRNSSFTFGNGMVVFDAGSKGGYYPNGIEGSQLTFGDGDSRTTVLVEGPAIYQATGISGSTLNLGGGVDEVDVQVAWNTNAWPLTGIASSTLDLGAGDDRLRVTLTNEQVSLSSWALSVATVEMGAGNDALEVRGINGITGGQVSGGDGNDTVDVITQQKGLDSTTLRMGAGNDRVTLTQSGPGALSVQNTTIELDDGDDTVQLSRGTATIVGGAGYDTLQLPGIRTDYAFQVLEGYAVLTRTGDESTNLRLEGMEAVLFSGDSQFIDLQPPTVVSFSPADEATGVAVGTNIVLTFSEPIQRGTGQIVLKTASGSTVAAYDAATSANLSISGSTLTLNPSADLSAGTAYKLEFAAGSVRDLADNGYEGTTDYNFTTTSALSYQIAANSARVDEGSVASFTITAGNVPVGTVLDYTISGLAQTDFVPANNRNTEQFFTGKATVGQNGLAQVNIPILADQTTEGDETLTVTVQGQSATVTLSDTSGRPNPVHLAATQHYYQYMGGAIDWDAALSNASALTYRGLKGYLVTVTSAAENDLLASMAPQWSVWIGASDWDSEGVWKWMSGPEAGVQFSQGTGGGNPVGGLYSNWYTPFLDNWAGGDPGGADFAIVAGNALSDNTFALPVQGNGRWGDTVNGDYAVNGYVVEYGGLPASYAITPSVTTVNEGGSVTFTIDTTNVEWGTTLSYTLSGISQADLSSGALTGTAVVEQHGVDGRATVTVQLAADQTTEGAEMLTLSVGGSNASVTVADSSTAPGTSTNLQGMAYHWKSHVLLSGVQVSVQDAAATRADPGQLLDLRAASFNAATGVLTVDVWADAGTASVVENFGFKAAAAGATAGSFTSALTNAAQAWSVTVNTEQAGSVLVAAFSLTGAAGPVKLGTLQLNVPAGSNAVRVEFNDVLVNTTDGTPLGLQMASATTAADGKYVFTNIAAEAVQLSASRAATDSGNAVNSADALAALRIAVGLNPNPDPDGTGPKTPPDVSPYQIMAADVNGSGTVTSADALAILRMAVKLSTALPQEWFFVEEMRDFWDEATQKFTLSRTNASWDRTITADPTIGPANLVGVLKGDVNGSWTPPAGSQSQDLDLIDPTYFQRLAELIGVPNQDQWGGPPPGL